MNELKKCGLDDELVAFIETGRPVLAICLGMQLLMEWSKEYTYSEGLGVIKGGVISIIENHSEIERIKLPNIGWLPVKELRGLTRLELNGQFYFVHSFMISPADSSLVVGGAKFKQIDIPAVLQRQNLVGCQFHPEKSGHDGLKFIESFLGL